MTKSRNRAIASAVAIALGVLVVVGALVYRINQPPLPCFAAQDVVQQGETLQGIATEYLTRNGKPFDYLDITNFVVDIQEASSISSDQVHAGQALAIPDLSC